MKMFFTWLNKHWEIYIGFAFFIFFCFLHFFAGLFFGIGAWSITWALRRHKKYRAKDNADQAKKDDEYINSPQLVNKYDFLIFRVTGVTFKNDDGHRRQTILRKIKFRDEEFEESLAVQLKQYDFEGNPAFGVYVNDIQIGNVPKDRVSELIECWGRIDKITALEVIGGGKDENGDRLNYGAEVYVRLFKEVPKS